jgi:hypothetical protein
VSTETVDVLLEALFWLMPVLTTALAVWALFYSRPRGRGQEWDTEVTARARQRGWAPDTSDSSRRLASIYWQGIRAGAGNPPFLRDGVTANALVGERRGRQVTAFEHHFYLKGHKHMQVVAVPTPAPCPRLDVRGRHRQWSNVLRHPGPRVLDRTVRVMPVDDPEFDRDFITFTDDEPFARLVLDPTVRRLCDFPFRLEAGHAWTFLALSDDPDGYLDLADYLIDLLERIPEQAWR